MTAIGESNFLHALGWAVLNSLWQMALLWVIYQLITGIISTGAWGKPISSLKKSSLAAALVIAGFGWFIYTFISILAGSSSSDTAISANLLSISGNEELNTWLHVTLPVASIIYMVLLIFPILHFGKNYRYVQLIRNSGLSKINVEWRMFVRKVSAQMGIKKPVHIWISELVSSPVTIGYLKPVILVPLAAINHLTTQQLEAVLLHELSHIRRYDYLINLVINFIQTILYFNPFVKAFVKVVEREREKSCDEMVIQFQYDPHGYASALLLLEKANHFPKPLAVAAAGKKNDLLHRIELILGVHKRSFISFNKIAGLFASLLCVIVLNALLILSKPVKGNETISFANLSSPFYFFTGDDAGKATRVSSEINSAAAMNQSKKPTGIETEKNKLQQPVSPAEYMYSPVTEDAPAIINVNYNPVDVPELKRYEEDQVKQAIEASKKVIEDVQWKEAEKNLADAFTENEKEQLKAEYLKEVSKFDWNQWENKLKLAYDNIDWDKINEQLGKAVTMIRIDSLQKVYTIAANNFEKIQQELILNNLKGIPDSDITLKEVENKKVQLLKLSTNLKDIRAKKIIRL